MQRLLSCIVLVCGLALMSGLQAQQNGNGAADNETVYEVLVRNLPSAGQAWSTVQPLRDMPDITVQNIDLDTSRVIIRVRGDLDRQALEQALEDSNLMLVYLTERTP